MKLWGKTLLVFLIFLVLAGTAIGIWNIIYGINHTFVNCIVGVIALGAILWLVYSAYATRKAWYR